MLRIYAVMDLKAGQVVHAVAGRRDEYRPLTSPLVRSSDPHEVARAFVERRGIEHAYVADLDAIAGKSPDINSITAIAAAGSQVILDAGVRSRNDAAQLLDQLTGRVELCGLVVPLESTVDPGRWPEMVECIGAQRAVFSLDLRGGRPITSLAQLQRQTPAHIAGQVWRAGFRRLIVLDLESVGTGTGPVTLQLCTALGQQHNWSELITGGGVRNRRDLDALEAAGCHAALIATALHHETDLA